MATPNYQFEKRKRDIEKKKKQDLKRLRKQEEKKAKKAQDEGTPDLTNPEDTQSKSGQ